MSTYIMSEEGVSLDLESMVHTFEYDSSGLLLTDTVVDNRGNTWRQTYTWNNGLLKSHSKWIKQ